MIAAEVGPGWFTGNPKYWGWQQNWYGTPRLIPALELQFDGGETKRILSDETWKTANVRECSHNRDKRRIFTDSWGGFLYKSQFGAMNHPIP